jgi:uncharacterized protein (DUF488 family)
MIAIRRVLHVTDRGTLRLYKEHYDDRCVGFSDGGGVRWSQH